MKRKKVLLVENHAQSRKALRLVLQSHGHEVTEAADPEDAAGHARLAFDAAIIDLGLAEPEGKVFAAQLLHANPEVLIIFMATSEDEDLWAIQGSVLLVKPLKMDVLFELL
jgi:DNA-binding response OmpR family regulator